MTYLPTTPEIQKDMLKCINRKSIDELLNIVPNNILLKSKMGLDDSMSELEIIEHIKNLTKEGAIPSAFSRMFSQRPIIPDNGVLSSWEVRARNRSLFLS